MTTADIPPGVAALRERQDVRAVFDIPWDDLLVAKQALYFQTAHERPLIAGQVTRRTTVDPAFLSVLQAALDPAHLRAAGADVVLLHKLGDAAGSRAARARARLGDPLYEDERVALFVTPPADAAPAAVVLGAPLGSVSDQAQMYLYTQQPGWLLLEADLDAVGRAAELRLDQVPIWRGELSGELTLRLPISVAAPGYHTLTLAVIPPCPAHIPAGLACRSLEVRRWSLDAEDGVIFDPQIEPIAFAADVTLADAFWSPRAQPGEAIEVWLSWRFGQGRAADDVRFVHLLDETGALAAQADGSLGALAAGVRLDEAVTVELPPALPPGRYTLYAGWYAFPDLTRLSVLAATPGARDGLALLGQIEVTGR